MASSSVADADARELDRRLLHLELVVSRLAEQVKQLTEDVGELRRAHLAKLWREHQEVDKHALRDTGDHWRAGGL